MGDTPSNRRRLAITHLCLGVLAAFAYWIPSREAASTTIERIGAFQSITAICGATIPAWSPYVLSWLLARSLLQHKDRPTLVFIRAAVVLTVVASVLYLAFGKDVDAIYVFAGLASALGITAVLSTSDRSSERGIGHSEGGG
jgi:hypothetical protein